LFDIIAIQRMLLRGMPYPEAGGRKFHQNIGIKLPKHAALHLRRKLA
jgi:hypothetical protein